MPTRFLFEKGFATIHADFGQPLFDLFSPPVAQKLPEELLSRLAAPYGVRVSNLKIDGADGDLGRAHISCSLPDATATLRIGFERFELESFFLERIGRENLPKLALHGAQAVIAACGRNPFATYMVDLGLHGPLPEASLREFLENFLANRPNHRGPFLGGGCVLYFGSQEAQQSSAITLDMSVVVQGGLFFRKRTVWDASKVPLEALPELAITQLDDILLELGLVLD